MKLGTAFARPTTGEETSRMSRRISLSATTAQLRGKRILITLLGLGLVAAALA
jgi:hypothetical protein